MTPATLELLRRSLEELVGGDRHRRARVGDDELRHAQLERPLDDERRRAALDRLGRELVAVRPLARDAEEERARNDRSRVVREVGDVGGAPPRTSGARAR